MSGGLAPLTAAKVLQFGELAHALELVGDRWTLLILRDAFLGVRRFEEWRRRTGASPATLTARLRQLCAHRLLRITAGDGPRKEYRLTARGLALYPVALSLWQWETRWSRDGKLPRKLVHSACGATLHPVLRCRHCEREATLATSKFQLHASQAATRSPTRSKNRRRNLHHRPGIDTHIFHSIDTVGDRWTMLLVAALMLGLSRHDELEAALGIATNILADRLQRLERASVVDRRQYRTRPQRYAYRLTRKGRAFFPLLVALQDFGRSLRASGSALLDIRHHHCNRSLDASLTCRNCRVPIQTHEVALTGRHAHDILTR